MACACGNNKKDSGIWLHTVNGTTKPYTSESEARAQASRLGGTVRKQ